MDEHSVFGGQALIEPLNPREMEILGYISEGLSNQQIAGRLHLSQETVKWYNKQIFSKLGVSSRTQAAARAAEIGVLGKQGEEPGFAEEAQPRHNLPAPLTSFVGRETEVAEIGRLLESQRLVVLTGAGGSGKTRLAIQAARAFAGRYRDGAWLVELAPLAAPDHVFQALADVLRPSTTSGEGLEQVIKRFLSRKNLLLVLDNFEHLLEAAPYTAEILAAAPRVTILVTSREPLHIYGEQEYPVTPLSLPELSRRETLEQIMRSDAVRLFLQRAQAVRPGLVVSDAQAAAIAQICIRLNGLPLALELAASQAKVYSFAQMVAFLNESLTTLPPGPRDLPSRQRTLRATIEWSYSLLTEQEKLLLSRLAVFAGGGTLDSIEAVCGGTELGDVRSVLASLVDKNMVVNRESRGGDLRFSLLETIREYALERLKTSGEVEDLRRSHAAHFAALAERADRDIRSAEQPYWFVRLVAERENFRAALHWSLGGEEIAYGLRLVVSLAYFWYYDGRSIEDARRWAHLALERSQGLSTEQIAGIELTAGRLALAAGNLKDGKTHLQRSLDGYNSTDNAYQSAWARVYLSSSYFGSRAEAQEGVEICQEGLAYFRQVQDLLGIAQALNIIGELNRWLENYDEARRYYEECLQVASQTGEHLRMAMQYLNLAMVAYHQQQPNLMPGLVRKGIHHFEAIGNDYGLVVALQSLVGAAILAGKPEKAVGLMGASYALLDEMGARFQPNDEFDYDIYTRVIKTLIDEQAFQAAWKSGEGLTLRETLDWAFEGLEQDETAAGPGDQQAGAR